MSNYFTYLPNVYVGVEESNGKFGYRLTKNIFRRVYLDANLEKYITAFESFYLTDDMRPEMVANIMYGQPELDWLVLITNNITDIYTQWPKSTNDLNEYINNKYDDPDSIHHWETNKIELEDGTLLVDEGIEVNESYRVTMPDGSIRSKQDSIFPITNAEYEININEKKRIISLPAPGIVDIIVEKFRDIVGYAPHPEIDLQGNKKSPNSTTSKYFNDRSYKTDRRTSALGQAVTSFDYGPTVASQSASNATASTSGTTTSVSVSSSTSTGGSGGY
jgi:hypothetical protein